MPKDIQADWTEEMRQAAVLVIAEGKCSTSFVQRKLGIGYNRAARIVEGLEAKGICSAPDTVGKRTVATIEQVQSVIDAVNKAAAEGTLLSEMPTAVSTTKHKTTAEDRKVSDATYNVAADELRQFIERWERLEAEKKDLALDQKEVMAEAKGRGYDTKVMRMIIALRKRDADDIAEEQAVLEMYKAALGML